IDPRRYKCEDHADCLNLLVALRRAVSNLKESPPISEKSAGAYLYKYDVYYYILYRCWLRKLQEIFPKVSNERSLQKWQKEKPGTRSWYTSAWRTEYHGSDNLPPANKSSFSRSIRNRSCQPCRWWKSTK